jgi:hypothetical protein
VIGLEENGHYVCVQETNSHSESGDLSVIAELADEKPKSIGLFGASSFPVRKVVDRRLGSGYRNVSLRQGVKTLDYFSHILTLSLFIVQVRGISSR